MQFIKDWNFDRSIIYTNNFYKELNEYLMTKSKDHNIAFFIKKNNTPLEFLDSFSCDDNNEYIIKKIDNLLMYKYHYISEYNTQESIEYINIYIQKEKRKTEKSIELPLITIKTNWQSSKKKNYEIRKIDETTALIILNKETIIEKYINTEKKVIRNSNKKGEILYYLNEDLSINKIEKTINLRTIPSQKTDKIEKINWGVIKIKDNIIEISHNKQEKIGEKENINEVLEYIKQKKIEKLFIENAKDSKILLDICSKIIETKEKVINKRQLISWKLSNISINCEIITTSSILPIDTKELNKTFNFEEQKKEIRNYEEGLKKYREWIYEITNLDVFKIKTIPYLAFKAWRTMFKEKEIPVITDIEEIGKASRNAYYGGWSELYKPKLKKGYIYDINSLYPYIMKNEEYPIGKEVVWSTDKNIDNYYGLIKAEIKVKNKYKNLLPLKTQKCMLGGNGQWKGWYTSEELKHALKIDSDIEIKIIEGYKFKKKGKIFKEFVDTFYEIKQNETININKRKIAKLILNSLSGFLGAYKKEISETISKEGIDWKTNKNKNIKNLINITIAAWITSLGRIHMSKYRLDEETIGIMIDSIITSKKLKELSNKNLGGWRLESEIYEGIFLNVDKYAYITKEGKQKIIWPSIKEKIKELKYEDFEKMLKKGNHKQIKVEESRIDVLTGKKKNIEYKYELNKNLPNRTKIYNKHNIWVDTISNVVSRNCGWVV